VSDINVEEITCNSCSKKQKKYYKRVAIDTIQRLSDLPKQQKPIKMMLPLTFVLED